MSQSARPQSGAFVLIQEGESERKCWVGVCPVELSLLANFAREEIRAGSQLYRRPSLLSSFLFYLYFIFLRGKVYFFYFLGFIPLFLLLFMYISEFFSYFLLFIKMYFSLTFICFLCPSKCACTFFFFSLFNVSFKSPLNFVKLPFCLWNHQPFHSCLFWVRHFIFHVIYLTLVMHHWFYCNTDSPIFLFSIFYYNDFIPFLLY